MSFTLADLEIRIRNRLQVLYNGDLDAAVAANVDAVIDELLSEYVTESTRAVVRSALSRSDRFLRLTEKATRIDGG